MRSIAVFTPWRTPKVWLRMLLFSLLQCGFPGVREIHIAVQARDRTRMEMADFNASLNNSTLSQDSLQSPRVERRGGTEGTANVLEAKYHRVKEADHAEEQEPPREVSSVQFNSSTPSTMGMVVEERQAPEAGPFSRTTRSQYGGTPDRRAYKASVVSSALRGEVEWVKDMRADASTKHTFRGYTVRVTRS